MKQPKPHTNHNHINPLSSSSPKNSRTGPRTSALNLSEWEEKRYIISALYLHYTLQETRNIMSKKYGCFHSEKLFKEKLNEWGLCKYMPISTAIWILNHEKWVRDRGNAVVYVFSGLRVSMGEIRRKIRRARVKIRIGECGGFDPTAPPNLEYMITGAENWDSSQDRITYTAFNSSSCDGSVHSDDSIDTLDNYISSEEFEPQSQIWTSPKRYNPTTPNANLAPKTWNNKCAQEILETYHEGIDIWHRTRHSEPSIQHLGTQTASLKFHEALFGFNYLHSPNDLKTRGAAYHLAECYAHLGQKEYFIAVLDWLGRELVRCGNRADETNAHIVKVMELFRVGGTPREAVGLLFTSLGE